MKNNPKISVIMSAYNCEDSIEKAILSIINQTYQDWELLIVDDASTDNTNLILKDFSKKNNKIKFYKNLSKEGLAYNLNRLIKVSNGTFIARMDADDISMPKRLEKQIKFLEKNKEIEVLGTAAKIIFQGKSKTTYPIMNHQDILKKIILKTPFIHPTVLMRKTFLIKNNLYRTKIGEVEDLDLWLRSCNESIFHNLQEALLIYKFNGQKFSRIFRSFFLHIMFSFKEKNIIYFIQSFLVFFIVLLDKFNLRRLSSLN